MLRRAVAVSSYCFKDTRCLRARRGQPGATSQRSRETHGCPLNLPADMHLRYSKQVAGEIVHTKTRELFRCSSDEKSVEPGKEYLTKRLLLRPRCHNHSRDARAYKGPLFSRYSWYEKHLQFDPMTRYRCSPQEEVYPWVLVRGAAVLVVRPCNISWRDGIQLSTNLWCRRVRSSGQSYGILAIITYWQC